MKKNHSLLIFCCVSIAVCGILSPPTWGQESADEVQDATPSPFFGSMDYSGNIHTSYDFRSFDGEDDSDIYTFFSLQLKDIYKDHVDGSFSMSWHEDLNGGTPLDPGDDYDPFQELDLSAGARFRYYTGYLDFKDIGIDDSSLRVGRQFLEEIDSAYFDGATYRIQPIDELEVMLFGGRPISYFSSTSGDATYGGSVTYRLTRQTKTGLTYYRYDTDEHNDDIAQLDLWHMFNENIQSHSEFSLLDGDPYLLKSSLYTIWDQWDVDAIFQVIRLFDDIGDHTINFDPYFPLLFDYEPFTYGSLNVTKGLGQYFSLIGGLDVRESDDISNQAIAYTNKNYVRLIGGVECYPTEQLTLSVNGEYWDVDSDDQFTGVTGEVEYRPTEQWELSAGLDYGEYVQVYRDEYLYVFGQDETFRITPDTITYFARARWKPTSKIYAGMRFEIEDNDWDDDNWYSVRLEVGSHF